MSDVDPIGSWPMRKREDLGSKGPNHLADVEQSVTNRSRGAPIHSVMLNYIYIYI